MARAGGAKQVRLKHPREGDEHDGRRERRERHKTRRRDHRAARRLRHGHHRRHRQDGPRRPRRAGEALDHDADIEETGDLTGATTTHAGAGGQMDNTGGTGTAPVE